MWELSLYLFRMKLNFVLYTHHPHQTVCEYSGFIFEPNPCRHRSRNCMKLYMQFLGQGCQWCNGTVRTQYIFITIFVFCLSYQP